MSYECENRYVLRAFLKITGVVSMQFEHIVIDCSVLWYQPQKMPVQSPQKNVLESWKVL